MHFKLISRTELADVSKRQLQFAEVGESQNVGQNIHLSGYFDAAYANALEVGATYELTLTKLV